MKAAVAVLRLRLPSAAMLVGLLLTLVVVVGAVLAPLLTRADPLALGMDILAPPGWAHPMGTDDLGRDLFARVLYGGRVSLGIGLFSGLLSVGFGVSVGLVAGFAGGVLDEFLMRLTEIFQVMPKLLAAVVQIASAIVSESFLSFLGLGDPGHPSWELLLQQGQLFLQQAWWLTTLPGIALAMTVLGMNLLGDGLSGGRRV